MDLCIFFFKWWAVIYICAYFFASSKALLAWKTICFFMLVSLESQVKKKCFEYVVLEKTRACFYFKQTHMSLCALMDMVQWVSGSSCILRGDCTASLAHLMFLTVSARGWAKPFCTVSHVQLRDVSQLRKAKLWKKLLFQVLLFLDFSMFLNKNHHYSHSDGSLGTQASFLLFPSLYRFLYLMHPNNQFLSSLAWGITQRFGCSS